MILLSKIKRISEYLISLFIGDEIALVDKYRKCDGPFASVDPQMIPLSFDVVDGQPLKADACIKIVELSPEPQLKLW